MRWKVVVDNLRNDYVYRKIFIIILAITIIPVSCTTMFFYTYTINKIRQAYIDVETAKLERVVITTEMFFQHIDYISSVISRDENMLGFSIDPDRDNYKQITTVLKQFNTLMESSEVIHSIYLYSRIPGYIIDSESGIYRIQEFYDSSWIDDFDSHYLGLHTIPTRTVVTNETKSYKLLSFIRNLPYGSWGKTACVVINVDESKFRSKYINMDREAFDGTILDVNGIILSDSDKERIGINYFQNVSSKEIFDNYKELSLQTVNGVCNTVVTMPGEFSKWTYFSKINETDIAGSVKTIFIITVILMIFIFVLILMLAVSLSKEFYKTHKMLGDVQKDFEQARPYIEGKILLNLINNRYSCEEDIIDDLKIIEMNFVYTDFIAVVMEIDKYEKLSNHENKQQLASVKTSLIEMIKQNFSEASYQYLISMIRHDMICAIVNIDNENIKRTKDSLTSLLQKVNESASRQFNWSMTIGIGAPYSNMINVNLSYIEALQAVENKFFIGAGKIIFYESTLMHAKEFYAYRSPSEQNILNAVKLGNQDEILLHIGSFFSELKDSAEIGISEIKDICMRLLHNLLVENNTNGQVGMLRCYINEFLVLETLDEIEPWFKEICCKTGTSKTEILFNPSGDAAAAVVAYINNNISNKNISLIDIGDAVGLSPSYISRLFKEHFGYNYLEYLNRSRIRKAKELLKDTGFSVSEIGSMVGFSLTQSFLRVFQRYEGTSPGKYRKKNIGGSE